MKNAYILALFAIHLFVLFSESAMAQAGEQNKSDPAIEKTSQAGKKNLINTVLSVLKLEIPELEKTSKNKPDSVIINKEKVAKDSLELGTVSIVNTENAKTNNSSDIPSGVAVHDNDSLKNEHVEGARKDEINTNKKSEILEDKVSDALQGIIPFSKKNNPIENLKKSRVGKILHLDRESKLAAGQTDSLKTISQQRVSDTIPSTQSIAGTDRMEESEDDVTNIENDTISVIQKTDSLNSDLAENGKIDESDSTNAIAGSLEKEINSLVPKDTPDEFEKRVEALGSIPSKYYKKSAGKYAQGIERSEGVSNSSSSPIDIGGQNDGERSLPPIDTGSLSDSPGADTPSLKLDTEKLATSELQGFESIKFGEKAMVSMVDNLKKSGKASYVKMTETFNPNKYINGIESKIEGQEDDFTSQLENKEKEFSRLQNVEEEGIGNLNHNIVSKDVLKEVDSLVSVNGATKYAEKEKKTAEGKFKEIKIKEPKDFMKKSFTELDVNVEHLNAKSVNITPKVGYHFLKQLDMGAGLNIQVPGSLEDVEKKLGYEVFSRFNMTQFMYLQAEGVALIPGMSNLEGNKESFDKTALIGLGYVQKLGGKVGIDLSVFHNPNQSLELENFKGYQWKMKMGLRFYEKTEIPKIKK